MTSEFGAILVRHCSTSWSGLRYCGTSDPPLDERGRRRATALAATLADLAATATTLVSSPRLRAIETATPVAAALGVSPVVVDERWSETDFGDAEGLSFEELVRRWPILGARIARGETTIDWPRGERYEALRDRVDAAVADLRPGTILVSHGGPLRIALRLLRADRMTLDPGDYTMLRRSPAERRESAVRPASAGGRGTEAR